VRFGAADLRTVRRVTARWAVRADLPGGRAEDFVIAVSEIAANAVRYGSPAARLLLQVTGRATVAEVRDSGYWPRPGTEAASAGGRSGGMGLALARLACDEVEIRAGTGGTTVLLRMSLLDAARPARVCAGRARAPWVRLPGAAVSCPATGRTEGGVLSGLEADEIAAGSSPLPCCQRRKAPP
jgi:anti-sigma regulatory factor (Ser/Thr protein kinase)